MKNYLEIGVARGKHMLEILRDKNIRYVGVDKWEHDTTLQHEVKKLEEYNTQEKWDGMYKEALLKLEPYKDRASIIRGSSPDVLPTLVDKFDFIYIDGDHSYQGAKKDLELSLPLLKEGGKIIVDDLQYPSVRRAFNEFVKENDVKHKGDTIWQE